MLAQSNKMRISVPLFPSTFSSQPGSLFFPSRFRLAFRLYSRRLLSNTTPFPFPGANQVHAPYSMDTSHENRVHLPDNSCVNSPRTWSSISERGCQPDISKQSFCNRSLSTKNIVAVGFDMDYTLAQYKPEIFKYLAYQGTIKKLVSDLGYPQELLNWSFDWKYMVRSLVLDKKRGDILKMFELQLICATLKKH